MKNACYHAHVPVNSKHPEYDANTAAWLRARDVLAGEDAIKAAGDRYLPKLEAQTVKEYDAYRARASFHNSVKRFCVPSRRVVTRDKGISTHENA